MTMSAMSSVDVIAFGETMIRFTPPSLQRFEQTHTLEMHVGGSESNTAVGLARLGIPVQWLSRLTDNPLGRHIAQAIAAHGVDVSQIVWTANDRVGTYYLERGIAPREAQVFYDRAGSAMSRMEPTDLNFDGIRQSAAKYFHTTGITYGISELAATTVNQALRFAKDCGMKISFDFNFRSRLWSADAAKAGCAAVLGIADLIFIPRRDIHTVYGLTADEPQVMCRELNRFWPQATIVLTLGAEGAAAIDPSGNFYFQPAFQTQEIERLGGGDAFSAGFLAGVIQGGSVDAALKWGAATAAVKYTIPGDLPLVDRELIRQMCDVGMPQASGIAR